MNSWPMRCASVIDAKVRCTQLSSGPGVGVAGAGVVVAGGVAVGDGVGLGVSVGVGVDLGEPDGEAVAVAGAAVGEPANTQPVTRNAMSSTGTAREVRMDQGDCITTPSTR